MTRPGRKPVRWDLIENGTVGWLDPSTGGRVKALDEMGSTWNEPRRQLARAEHSRRCIEWFQKLAAAPEQFPRLPACAHGDESMLWEFASQWAIEDMRRARLSAPTALRRALGRNRGIQSRISDEILLAAYRKMGPKDRANLSQAAAKLATKLHLAPGTVRNRLAKIVARKSPRNR